MNANDVIKIGRRRNRAASVAAVSRSCPRATSSLANSTIKIAFLQAKPTSTTNPICVKMLLSIARINTPVIAASKHIGTMRIIEAGNAQLSYSAASTRNTKTTQSGKI